MKMQTVQTIHGIRDSDNPYQRAKAVCDGIGHGGLVEKFGKERVDDIRATVFDVDMGFQGFQSKGSGPSYDIVGHMSIAEARYLCREMTLENRGNMLIPIHLSGYMTRGDTPRLIDAMAFVYGYYRGNGKIAFLARTMGENESMKLVSLRRDAIRHESLVWDPAKTDKYTDAWTYAEGLYLGPAAIAELETAWDSFQKTLETLVDVFDDWR